jgi:hypothetical protein
VREWRICILLVVYSNNRSLIYLYKMQLVSVGTKRLSSNDLKLIKIKKIKRSYLFLLLFLFEFARMGYNKKISMQNICVYMCAVYFKRVIRINLMNTNTLYMPIFFFFFIITQIDIIYILYSNMNRSLSVSSIFFLLLLYFV